MLLVGLLVYQGYRNERDAVSAHMVSTARALATVVDSEMDNQRSLLQGLVAARAIAEDNIPRFEDHLRSIELGGDRWLVLSDRDGQQLINTRLPRGAALPAIPYVPEHQAAISQGRTYISNLTLTPVVPQPVMFVSMPIMRDGTHKYTLSAVALAKSFTDSIAVRQPVNDITVAIVDREGTIAARHPNGEKFIGTKAMPDIVAAARTGFQGIKESVTLEGKRVLAVVARAPNSGWSVAMGAPYAALFATAQRLLWWGLSISAVLLTVAVVIASWIGRALVHDVDCLVDDTRVLARGEIPSERRNGLAEVDTVAQALRQTARTLQERDRDTAALYDVVARVNRAAALGEIFEATIAAILRCEAADRVAILVCNGQGSFQAVSSRGFGAENSPLLAGCRPWPARSSTHATVVFLDVTTADLPSSLRADLRGMGVSTLVFVPLLGNGRLLGAIALAYNVPRHLPVAQLKSVETIASQVAYAIERQKNADALEALVDERTASLREAVAQMEEFSYSVSHDLRAPVRALFSYAEVILQEHSEELSTEARELLTRIQRNSRRMDQLIQDLLSYTRISRREIRLERVSVEKLIEEVRHQYAELHDDRADIEISGRLPDVTAHEPSLSQVVSNLLTNAVKFVAPGVRPHVRIGCDWRPEGARVWFCDNGIGIKPEAQGRLFKMFERAHGNSAYEGTGIGLAIVRKAVERMNGTVGVSSDGVNGSTFWFELPLAPPARAEARTVLVSVN